MVWTLLRRIAIHPHRTQFDDDWVDLVLTLISDNVVSVCGHAARYGPCEIYDICDMVRVQPTLFAKVRDRLIMSILLRSLPIDLSLP